MHPIVFCLNWLMMVSIPALVVFFLFFSSKQLYIKGYVGIAMVCWCILVMLITVLHLKISFKNVFKTFIILDTMWLSFGIAALAFLGLMYFLDRGKWEMKMLQLSFIVAALSKFLNFRLLLLFMKWNRNQVIAFKVGLFIMALTYLNVGVYCIYTNYSFTYNILKAFDQQCKYFVLLFTFAGFEFMANMIRTMSGFDYSDLLRDEYIIKDFSKDKVDDRIKIARSFKNFPKENIKQEKEVHFIPVVQVKKAVK